MTTTLKNNKATKKTPITYNSYDESPYESFTFPFTHPQHLYTIANLFGLKAANFTKCKVLELGCASGGNIIPLAYHYPKSKFTGVDLSIQQINEGQKHINNLELKNIKLINLSIKDLNEDLGKFDYIICHGVFSWVEKDIQNKIMEICQTLLAPKGLAFISYNTLPGWHTSRTVRDMMLYHSSYFDTTQEKITQSKALLNFIHEAVSDSNNSYATLLHKELDMIKDKTDSYLKHDHLELNNSQFYFHQFIEKAQEYNLQYVADSSIHTMFVGNMPHKVAEKLSVIDDLVRQEQYMDFIINRRFRNTILCHKSVKLNRNIAKDVIEKFYIRSLLKPDRKIENFQLINNCDINFKLNNNSVITTHTKISGAIYYTLYENNIKPISLLELINKTKEKVPEYNDEEIKNTFLELAVRLVLNESLIISSENGNYINYISEKPKINDLNIYQTKHFNWLTNGRQEVVNISETNNKIIQLLDGRHNIDDITKEIIKLIDNKILSYSPSNPEESKQDTYNNIKAIVINTINLACNYALLVG